MPEVEIEFRGGEAEPKGGGGELNFDQSFLQFNLKKKTCEKNTTYPTLIKMISYQPLLVLLKGTNQKQSSSQNN